MSPEELTALVKRYQEWKSLQTNPKYPGRVPSDLREGIIAATESYPVDSIAKKIGISHSAISHWKKGLSFHKSQKKAHKLGFVEVRSSLQNVPASLPKEKNHSSAEVLLIFSSNVSPSYIASVSRALF